MTDETREQSEELGQDTVVEEAPASGEATAPELTLPPIDEPVDESVAMPDIPVTPAEPQRDPDSPLQWYIVHTYSGFEERVKETLLQRAEALDMADAFGEVRIPTEKIVEYKGGKKKESERKFFPGYILVEMEMSDAAWHVVKNTPKVTGFVGSGRKPQPLTQEEVNQILEQVDISKEKPMPKYIFDKGEPVKIIDGPFSNFTGIVEEVNLDRATLKVVVTIFGRPTPVELEFIKVQKL